MAETLARWKAALQAAGPLVRFGSAGLAGAASMLAFAPFHAFPVLLVTLPVLVFLLDGLIAQEVERDVRPREGAPLAGRFGLPRRTVWRAAAVGWWFGFGFHAAGLFWIGEAFLVEADKFAALLPFAVTLMPAGLAIFHALAAVLVVASRARGLRLVLAFALALALTEWLRGTILTGFPWNVLGYAITFPLPLMQAASWLGIYGLTLLAAFVFAAPAVILTQPSPAPVRRLLAAIGVFVVPLALLYLHGAVRLAAPPPADIANVRVRVVQPSIPQRDKWRPERQREFFDAHLSLTERPGLDAITHVIWPEAAMPFLPLDTPQALSAIADSLQPGQFLLAGVLRVDRAGPRRPDGRLPAFNSLAAFDSSGRLAGLYDKIHLVPFGEYLPFQDTLEAIGLEQLSRWRGGFTAGPSPRPLLSVPGLPPLGVLICYEAIFPAAAVQTRERPAILLNVTNDGWFGHTTGPYQHFHQSRVRAVEEGIGLVRAGNNGISAIIDGHGRVRERLALDAVGVINAGLPGALPPPLYATFGNGLFWVAWLLGVFCLLMTKRGINQSHVRRSVG